MKSVNTATFKKEIAKKGYCEEVQVDHYFTLESWSAKTVILSDQVTEMTSVTYRRKQIALVFPYKGNTEDSLQLYYKELQHLVRALAPVISVFDMKGKKIAVLREVKEALLA